MEIYLRNGSTVTLNPETKDQVHTGLRGNSFREFLREVMKLSNLKAQYIDVLLDEEYDTFEDVFTHKSANTEKNYEFYEFIGDVTLNKSIAWYLTRRFPQLNCPEGVKILTRLKINLVSKKSFSKFAENLHFWPFVSASLEVRTLKMGKTLEDVFEAFFGSFEMLIDKHWGEGLGYQFCYTLISKLLDSIDISLKYEHLFDSKTRLKELIDYFGEKIGKIEYTAQKEDRIHYVTILHNKRCIATGSAPLKADAQQKAAEKAIYQLSRQGFIRPLVGSYAEFCS